MDTYKNDATRECNACSSRCTPNMGCTGGGDFYGDGGCNHCEGLIIESDDVNATHTCRLRTQVKNGASYEVCKKLKVT